VNGFTVLLITMSKWMTNGVCWTTTYRPRSCDRFHLGHGQSRNSMWARPDRIAAARTDVSVLMRT